MSAGRASFRFRAASVRVTLQHFTCASLSCPAKDGAHALTVQVVFLPSARVLISRMMDEAVTGAAPATEDLVTLPLDRAFAALVSPLMQLLGEELAETNPTTKDGVTAIVDRAIAAHNDHVRALA